VLTAAPLSTLIALARAGALDHAWAQFCAAGYDRADDDPAALTVKGRLLKDYALRSEGEERRAYYLKSAEAYRRSAALQPATYPLINAATLSLLSGDRAQAEEIAREVLDRIAREPEEPETPYWRAATEAEALLLLGRLDEAKAALDAAVAAAPAAWEDHASTLRQFLIIQDMLGGDIAWLDRLRPRRSLYFSAVPAGEVAAGQRDEIARILAEEDVGFGFGSLAAGAEILVAEALLERGADLHVVLPSDAESFAAAFVDPFGADWRRRFDTLLDAAESLHNVRPLRVAPDPAMAALAGEEARGAALYNAECLLGEALALCAGTEPPAGLRTRAVGGPAPAPPQAPPPESNRVAVALIALGVGGGGEADFEGRLELVQSLLGAAGSPSIAPHLSGDCILTGFSEPQEAARVARRLHIELGARAALRIAGHYGLVPCVRDPFSGALRPTEAGAAIVTEIAGAMPPETICVSFDFAASLAARTGAAGDASPIGELAAFDGGSPIGLYALKR
jgi:hypothetical protein